MSPGSTISDLKTRTVVVPNRSGNAKFRQFLATLIIILMWIPSITSAFMDVNLTIFVCAIAFLLSIGSNGKINVVLGSKEDYRSVFYISITVSLIALFSVLSIFYVEDTFRVFRVVAGTIFGLFIIMSMTSLNLSSSKVVFYFNLFIWGGVLSSAYVIVSFYVPWLRELNFGTRDRTQAFFKQANQFGMALTMVMPLLTAALLVERRRIFRGLQILVLYGGLVFSGSKTNIGLSAVTMIITILIGLGISGYLKRHPFQSLALLIGVAILGVIGFDLLGALNPRAQRLLSASASGESIQSWGIRLEVWRQSIADGMQSPLLGVGAGRNLSVNNYPHSHNVFVDYFRTMGIPGLALVIVLVSLVVGLALRSILGRWNTQMTREAKFYSLGLGISALGYIAANQMSDSFGPSTLPLLWIVIALMLLFGRGQKSTTTDAETRSSGAQHELSQR